LDWWTSSHKFVSTNQIGYTGKTVQAGNQVIDGPYISGLLKIKMVGGYMVIKVGSLEEAVEIAKNCPIIKMGGTVEM